MKKIKMLAVGLMFSLGSISTQAADCSGLLVSLDELRYLDADELQFKICAVPKFMDIYMQMMNIDELGACTKVTNLASKVLDREHGEKPYTKEKCKEVYPDLVD
jgi:hypothetical protein